MEDDLFRTREDVINAFNLNQDLSNEDILKVLKEKIQDCHPDRVEGKENEAKRITAAMNCMKGIIKEEQGGEMSFPIRAFNQTMVKFSEELTKMSEENQKIILDNKKITLEERAQGVISSYRSKMTTPAIYSSLIWGFMAIWVIFPKALSENPWIPQVEVTPILFLIWLGILLLSFVLWGFKYYQESKVKEAISYLNLEKNRLEFLDVFLGTGISHFVIYRFVEFVCENLCRKRSFRYIRESYKKRDFEQEVSLKKTYNIYDTLFVRPLFNELIKNEIVHSLLQQTLEKAVLRGLLGKLDNYLYDEYWVKSFYSGHDF